MTVRVGIIGTGFARRVQIPGLAFVPGVQVTAIASGRRANAEAVAREFAIPAVFDDGAALARAPDVDVVLVSSTPDSHARYAVAALEAGKHVLCEKPVALNVAEAEQMLAAAERQPRLTVDIVDEVAREPGVVGHLVLVQPQPHDLARRTLTWQMAAPAGHQIQQSPTGRQHLGVQPCERRDGAIVDVNDLARDGVKALVRRLILPRVRLGRERVGQCAAEASGIFATTSVSCTAGE